MSHGQAHAVDVVLQPVERQSDTTVMYGKNISSDPCLVPVLERERYFLNKLIPRHENFTSILRVSCSTWGLQ